MFSTIIRWSKPRLKCLLCRQITTESAATDFLDEEIKTRRNRVKEYVQSEARVMQYTEYIPEEVMRIKQSGMKSDLYLIDPIIAKSIGSTIINSLCLEEVLHRPQVICEINPGLGLIASELLNQGVPKIRLFEPLPQFREYIKKNVYSKYPGRIELFKKNLLWLAQFSNLDKADGGNRIEQILRDVPTRSWEDDPVITLIGVLPSLLFLKFLVKMLALQHRIINYGRIQLFILMKPHDYLKLTAGPHHNLRVYVEASPLCQLFFEYELLNKFPRSSFVPWETDIRVKQFESARKDIATEMKNLYFVQINFKKELPLNVKEILPFYYFIQQIFKKPSQRIIPYLEHFCPGIGFHLLTGSKDNLLRNMNIYTQFRHLHPEELLLLYKEISTYLMNDTSVFLDALQNHLLSTETVETQVYDPTQKTVTEDIEEDLTDVAH